MEMKPLYESHNLNPAYKLLYKEGLSFEDAKKAILNLAEEKQSTEADTATKIRLPPASDHHDHTIDDRSGSVAAS